MKSSFCSDKSSSSSQRKLRLFLEQDARGYLYLESTRTVCKARTEDRYDFELDRRRGGQQALAINFPFLPLISSRFQRDRVSKVCAGSATEEEAGGLLLGLPYNYRGQQVKSKVCRIDWQTQDLPRSKGEVQG